jgi:hypothetical protein
MRGNKPMNAFANSNPIIHNDWPWVYKTYTLELNMTLGSIKKVTIDPSTWMADVELSNNTWPATLETINYTEPAK